MESTIASLRNALEEAEFVVIGAGAGLSSAAGFEYGGETFLREFPEMHRNYGYEDQYSAGFHPFDTLEEKWGYWAKSIYLLRYKEGARPLYKELLSLVKGKDYFVITTNVDHQFQLAGFDKKRLFYMQGDYGLFQCSLPCSAKTYDNEESVRRMVRATKGGLIPSSLVPHCPVCGAPMETNLRSDERFVEDEGWHEAKLRYEAFLKKIAGKKVLFLKLGVGYSTPVWIKYPFLRMTFSNPNAIYATIDLDENPTPSEIEDRTLSIQGDIKEVIGALLRALSDSKGDSCPKSPAMAENKK